MEHRVQVPRAKVPQPWCIARNAFVHPRGAFTACAHGAKPDTTFADAQRKPVARAKLGVVTMGAGDISVARQDRIVEQGMAQGGLCGIKGQKICACQRCRQIPRNRRCRQEGQDQTMRTICFALILIATSAGAEIEAARDMMEEGRFEEAYETLWPAARSGNADAEELIGVMYAMGLGVTRDDQRAFEWYLRSAMKGHPGAQSGVGWYYEVGRGLPAPDLVRAYMWYTLSAIGGDPDAAISLEEVVKKMTQEEIEKAHVLVADYKVWMYPFR